MVETFSEFIHLIMLFVTLSSPGDLFSLIFEIGFAILSKDIGKPSSLKQFVPSKVYLLNLLF
jgi:hypothetical protein